MIRSKIVAHVTRLIVLCVISLVAAGCWDHLEINQRSFVIGVGIDLPQDQDAGNEAGAGARNRPAEVRMATEIVLWRGSDQSAGSGSSFLPELTKPARIVAGTGRSLFDVESILNTRVNRELYWSHLKTIFIGEQFAREVGLKPIIDFFTRDYEFNRRMRIGITQGEALPYIEATMLGDDFVGEHVASMFEHSRFVVRAPDGNFNDLDANIRNGGNILLPRFTLGDGEIKVGGSAIIKQGKMVGWLGEAQSIWALFVLNELPGGSVLVPDPADPVNEVLFGINKSRTQITFQRKPDKPVFKLNVQTEGDILERVSFDASPLDTKWLADVEKAVARTIEAGMQEVVDLLQNTYKVDALGFNHHLEKHEPHFWKQQKDNWDDVGFARVAFEITATVTIRRHGTTR